LPYFLSSIWQPCCGRGLDTRWWSR